MVGITAGTANIVAGGTDSGSSMNRMATRYVWIDSAVRLAIAASRTVTAATSYIGS